MTLYLDCDNTLVLWQDEAGEVIDTNPWKDDHGEKYRFNNPLIKAVDRWGASNPDEDIVVWSGGGDWYAQLWLTRILFVNDIHEVHYFQFKRAVVLSKNPIVPQKGDIVVDDSVNFASQSEAIRYLPEEFIESVGAVYGV